MDQNEKKVQLLNTKSEEKNYQISAYLSNYIKTNPVKSITAIILGIGGILLLFFFMYIGFMPDVTLNSITSVLYAISALGILTFLSLIFLLALPILYSLHDKEIQKINKWSLLFLNFDAVIFWCCFLSYNFKIIGRTAFFIDLLICVCVVILTRISILIDIIKKVYHILTKKNKKGNIKQEIITLLKEIKEFNNSFLIFFKLIFVLIFPIFVLINLILNIQLSNETECAIRVFFLVFLLIYSFISVAITTAKGTLLDKIKASLFFSAFIFLIILFHYDSLSFTFLNTFKRLGLGEINSARISVTKETCQEINQTLGKKVCENQSVNSYVPICPVKIKSRIGNQVVLEFFSLIEVSQKEKNDTNNNSTSKNKYYWLTSKKIDNSNENIRMTQLVIVDKNKINALQPLTRIEENNFETIKEMTIKQNTMLNKTNLGHTSNSDDNQYLKLVTLYDALQNLRSGDQISSVDEFLLNHCKEVDASDKNSGLD